MRGCIYKIKGDNYEKNPRRSRFSNVLSNKSYSRTTFTVSDAPLDSITRTK